MKLVNLGSEFHLSKRVLGVEAYFLVFIFFECMCSERYSVPIPLLLGFTKATEGSCTQSTWFIRQEEFSWMLSNNFHKARRPMHVEYQYCTQVRDVVSSG
jgi:hypothetical protein